MKTCILCENKPTKNGYCIKHYHDWRKARLEKKRQKQLTNLNICLQGNKYTTKNEPQPHQNIIITRKKQENTGLTDEEAEQKLYQIRTKRGKNIYETIQELEQNNQ